MEDTRKENQVKMLREEGRIKKEAKNDKSEERKEIQNG
jgi:hypothetical protein